MNYNKAAIITPNHKAFLWTKSKRQLDIPDEYSSNIKHVQLAKDFTCILNLNNEAVCIEDNTGKIIQQQSNVNKIIYTDIFLCYIKTDSTVTCNAFEDKQRSTIPTFQVDQKIKDLDIRTREYNGYKEIFQCSFDEINNVDCFIDIINQENQECKYSQKIDFGQNIKALDQFIIQPESITYGLNQLVYLQICFLDQNQWHCYATARPQKQLKCVTEEEYKKYNPNMFKLEQVLYPKNFEKQYLIKKYTDTIFFNEIDLPSGVKHDIPKSNFSNWKILQEADWNAATKTTDINKEVDGDILFVGAQKESSETIYIGAYGMRKDIIQRTQNNTNNTYQTNFFNNIQWYYVEGQAFGFSDISIIKLDQADVQDSKNNNKLSWNLNGQGGYRAGNAVQNNYGSNWKKIIYQFNSNPTPENFSNSNFQSKSEQILDQAYYGDSYCELGDQLEISCQNFPLPINLYRDTIKQQSKKEIEDQIEFQKLKNENDYDEKNKIKNNNQDSQEKILKLEEGYKKIETDAKYRNKSLRQMVQALFALVVVLITFIIQNQFQSKNKLGRNKDDHETQVSDQQVDINLDNDQTNNSEYISKLKD